MDKLTAKLDGKGVIMLPSGVEHDWCIGTRKIGDVTIQYLSGAAADRLAAYEDTGLTPEDIQTMRGELCLKCGLYERAHMGACNGCRWRKEV